MDCRDGGLLLTEEQFADIVYEWRNIICTQSLDTFHGINDMVARQAYRIDVSAIIETHLRGERLVPKPTFLPLGPSWAIHPTCIHLLTKHLVAIHGE